VKELARAEVTVQEAAPAEAVAAARELVEVVSERTVAERVSLQERLVLAGATAANAVPKQYLAPETAVGRSAGGS